MTKFIASAPGSVMLTGEHAVLLGHRAIACAVNQRTTVTLTPRDDDKIFVRSALGSVMTSLSRLPKLQSDSLSFVVTSLQQFSFSSGFEFDIESDINPTLGLGSSAAVTLATVSACQQFTQENIDLFNTSFSIIQSVQGRGSGADLSASLMGGIVGYTIAKNEQQTDMTRLDADKTNLPSLSLHYAGYKTKTAEVLKIVADKAEEFPELYAQIYALMHQVSLDIEATISLAEWKKMGKLMNMYQGLMDALGVNDKKLSEIVYNLRAEKSVLGAKISGSGLGDCVIALHDGEVTSSQDSAIQFSIAKKGLTQGLMQETD